MANINLLPIELAPKSSIIKLAKFLKKVALFGYILFTVSIVVAIAVFFLVNNQLKKAISEQEGLKVSIEALQETEQKLLLTQDRLKKSKLVLGMATAEDEIVALESFVANLPEGVVLGGSELSADNMNMSFSIKTSDAFSDLLAMMYESELFESIVISSASLTPSGTFEASFSLSI